VTRPVIATRAMLIRRRIIADLRSKGAVTR
jgi:hypothetical protein